MSLKQLPLASLSSPLKIPISLPQITTSTYPSHKYLSHSRYDNNHEKPSFQPPIPKNLSFDADTDLDSLPLDESVHLGHITSCENVVPDKSPAGDIPVKLLFTNPLSPTASQKPKKALLVTEEPSMEFEGKASPGFSTPTIVKEIDSDLSGSEIIQVTDANQVETVVFEQRKPSTANVLFSTLVPSRFALDVMSRNVLRTSNEAKPGDNRPKALSGDEGNQSIVGGGHTSPTAHMPKARRKWRQLSHVFHSITLIQKPEAASISQKDIAAEIDNFPLKKEKFDIHDRIIFRREGSREAFEMLRTVKMLCDCAKIGSPKHIEVMKEILANDIRKHLYEPKDADHLLNRYNTDGFPPLCLAAQNGNLEVVKMLIDKGADHLRETKPPQAKKSKEVALELAVRWNHVRVVEYLLDKFVHPADILNNCLKVAESKNLKEMLMKYMNAHNISHKKRAACYTK